MFAALALLDQYLNSRRGEPRGSTSDGTGATA
jgi:hypothetical protein